MTNMKKKNALLVDDGIKLDLEATNIITYIDVILYDTGGTSNPPRGNTAPNNKLFNGLIKIKARSVKRISVTVTFADDSNELLYLDDPDSNWRELESESGSSLGSNLNCDPQKGCPPDAGR